MTTRKARRDKEGHIDEKISSDNNDLKSNDVEKHQRVTLDREVRKLRFLIYISYMFM